MMEHLNRLSKKVKSFVIGVLTMLVVLPSFLLGVTIAANEPHFNDHPQEPVDTYMVDNRTQSAGNYASSQHVQPGDVLSLRVYIHNNQLESFANNTIVRATLDTTNYRTSFNSTATIYSANAIPSSVSDSVTITANQPVKLNFLDGQTKRFWYINGVEQSETIYGNDILNGGVNIGSVQGCWEYIQYVIFRVQVEAQPQDTARLTIAKNVRNTTDGQTTFVDSTNADVNENVEFEITITNNGGTVAQNVIVRDIVPNGLTYVNNSAELLRGSNRSALSNDLVSGGVNIGSLAVNETVRVYLDATAVSAGTRTNTGFTRADGLNEISDTAYVVVTDQPDDDDPHLTIDKQVALGENGTDYRNSVTAEDNDVVRFRIVVTNSGEGEAENVEVTDSLPNYLDYISGSTELDGNDINNITSGIDLDDMSRNESHTITFNARVNRDTDATLTNTAYAEADNNSRISDTAVVSVNGDDPDREAYLRVTKEVDNDEVEPGDRVTFTVNVENTGDETAYDVEIIDYLPSRLRYISGTLDYNLNGNGDVDNDDELFGSGMIVDEMEPGDDIEISFEARVDSDANPGSTLTNEVRAEDRDGHRGEDEASVYVNGDNAYLNIEKTVNRSTAKPGDRLEYTIVVENTGDEDAINVRIYDELPDYIEVLENTLEIDGEYITREDLFDEDGYIRASRLADGDEIRITFEADIEEDLDRDRTLENVARVTADDGLSDRDVASTFVDVQGNIQDMEISLVKLVRNDTNGGSFGSSATANPGNILEFKVTVTNTGNETIRSLRLRDVMPSQYSYLGGTAKATLNNQDLGGDFNLIAEPDGLILPDLTPGSTFIIMYKAKTDTGIGDQVTLSNTVQSTNDDINRTASANTIFSVIKKKELPPAGPDNMFVGVVITIGLSVGAWLLRRKFNPVSTL